LTTDATGSEAGSHPCTPLYPCTSFVILSLPPFLHLEKRKRDQKKKEGPKKEKVRKKGDRKKYQDLEGVAFSSSLSHGGAGLDSFHHYAKLHAKTLEAWVYGSSGARRMSCARGPCIPCTYGGIHGVLCDVL
jgi:hypothetical protein